MHLYNILINIDRHGCRIYQGKFFIEGRGNCI